MLYVCITITVLLLATCGLEGMSGYIDEHLLLVYVCVISMTVAMNTM